MKKNIRRAISLLAAVVMIIVLTAACQTPDDTQGNQSTTSSSPSPSAPAQSQAPPTFGNEPTKDPFGKYDPPIDVTVAHVTIHSDVNYPPGDTPENNIWTRTYAEELGINVDVVLATQAEDAQQTINLMIATGDLPDIMSVTKAQFQEMYEAGLLYDLTEVFEEYATPFLREQLYYDGGYGMASATRDGRLYAVPSFLDPVDNAFMLWVREDWRKELGLPEPKTIEDFYAIAEGFTNAKGVPGFTVTEDLWAHLHGFFNAYGAYPGHNQSQATILQWKKDPNGDGLVLGATLPEVKTALLELQRMYANGWIDRDYALANYDTLTADFANGRVGMVYGLWWYPIWPMDASKRTDPNAEWKAYPMPSALNAVGANVQLDALMMRCYNVVTKNCKNPEAAIKMANLTLEKCFGENADPERFHGGPTPDVGSAMYKFSVFYVEIGHKNILKFRAINEALESGNINDLTPDQLMSYNNVLKWTQNGDVDHWGNYMAWGIGGAFDIYDYYATHGLFSPDELWGTIESRELTDYGPIWWQKLYEATNDVIMGADISVWDDFVDYFYQTGGREYTRQVNEWYAVNK